MSQNQNSNQNSNYNRIEQLDNSKHISDLNNTSKEDKSLVFYKEIHNKQTTGKVNVNANVNVNLNIKQGFVKDEFINKHGNSFNNSQDLKLKFKKKFFQMKNKFYTKKDKNSSIINDNKEKDKQLVHSTVNNELKNEDKLENSSGNVNVNDADNNQKSKKNNVYTTNTDNNSLIQNNIKRNISNNLFDDSTLKKKTSFIDNQNSSNVNFEILQLDNFKVIATIGIGSLSKVKLVQDKFTNTVLAVKIINIKTLYSSKQEDKIRNEFEILKVVDHPFVIKLKSFNVSSSHIFFGLQYIPGGDLFNHLRVQGVFSIEESRFYFAQIICSIIYLHSMGVIYRDIKPENFLICSDGYIKLTDFSISKPCRGKTFTFCGTPEYSAPEIISGIGHTKACDFWSMGIILYEFIFGFTPFSNDSSPFTIYENVLSGKYKFPSSDNFIAFNNILRNNVYEKFNNNLNSPELKDAKIMIKQLLIGDPNKRLGSGSFDNTSIINNISNLVNNPFFINFNWIELEKKQMQGFFIPKIKNNADTSNFAHFCDDSYENLLDYAFENYDSETN